jgi:predicted Zn-dependent protease
MAPRTRVIEAGPAATLTGVVQVPAPVTDGSARRRKRFPLAATAMALGVGLVIVTGVASHGAIRRARARAEVDEGIAAYRQGRADEAAAKLTAATADAPTDPRPHVYLSRLAREANDLVRASAEGVRAVRLAPNDPPALRELATTLYAMQNFEGARAFYVRAIQADPADHSSQGYLGCALIRLGRVDEGMRWLERAGRGTWSACAPESRG